MYPDTRVYSLDLRDLIDINGDGLPDIVDQSGWSTTGVWQVVLNRGNGFSDTILDWPSPLPLIREGLMCPQPDALPVANVAGHAIQVSVQSAEIPTLFLGAPNAVALTGRGHDATFPAWVECVLRRGPVQRLG